MFGWMRFFTGLGVGALVATTGALVSEYAPKGKKNLCNAITYSGVPLGSLLAALLAILLLQSIGWRGMFWIGALPIVTLLPLAYFKMPESVAWLASRGRLDEARAVSERTGVEIPEAVPTAAGTVVPVTEGKPGFAGLFGVHYLFPTIVLGLMSATGLLLVYSLNTWLPELMLRAGFNAKGSLSFLLVLNGGAILGALGGSRVADRFGPKPVVAACFLIGALAIALLTLSLPLGVLLAFVAIVGLGTSGTQTLIYGFVANYYRTNVRGAGVAWCAGFGRLGGVGGPLLGGFLIGARLCPRLDLLRAGGARPAGSAADAAGADLACAARIAFDAHRADAEGSTGQRRRRSPCEDLRPETRHVQADSHCDRRHAHRREPIGAEAHRADRPADGWHGVRAACGAQPYRAGRHHGRRGPGRAQRRGRRRGARTAQVVQAFVDQLCAAGIDAHGEMLSATEHDIADVILQRARELDVDLLVLGHQHHRGTGHVFRSSVAEQVIHQHPPISILLARPPTVAQ